MKTKYLGHILKFKLEVKELNAPDRAWIRFIETMKKNIPWEHRDYDEDSEAWYIDRKYEPIIKILRKHYFKE